MQDSTVSERDVCDCICMHQCRSSIDTRAWK